MVAAMVGTEGDDGGEGDDGQPPAQDDEAHGGALDESRLVEEEDEEDAGIDRRSFVKGALGGAVLGAVGAAGAGLLGPTFYAPPTRFVDVDYLGAKVLAGSPAPRGLAIAPVAVDDDGFLVVRPENLDWFRYCGLETSPALQEGHTEDDRVRYFIPQDKITEVEALGRDPEEVWWYLDRLGEPVRAEEFMAQPVGAGASTRWRSEGLPPGQTVPLILLRLDPETLDPGIVDDYMEPESQVMAYSGTCTHFCCVPGWKESPVARAEGHWDDIFCTCHLSSFDPRDIERYSFRMRVADEDA